MVNFTNIIRAHLRQYSSVKKSSNLKFKDKKNKFKYEKAARKMLVKVTPRFLSHHQVLRQMQGDLCRSRHRRQGEEVRERHRRHPRRQRGGVGEAVATDEIFPARKSLLDP
jgi:hypothetical protein